MLDLHDAAARLVERSEPPVPVREIERRSRTRRLRRRSAVVASVVLVLVCSVGTIALLHNGSNGAASGVRIETSGGPLSTRTARLALDTIPDGVSARTIGSTPVFLVSRRSSGDDLPDQPTRHARTEDPVVVPHRTNLRRTCARRNVRHERHDPRWPGPTRSGPARNHGQQRNGDRQSPPRPSWPNGPRRRLGPGVRNSCERRPVEQRTQILLQPTRCRRHGQRTIEQPDRDSRSPDPSCRQREHHRQAATWCRCRVSCRQSERPGDRDRKGGSCLRGVHSDQPLVSGVRASDPQVAARASSHRGRYDR